MSQVANVSAKNLVYQKEPTIAIQLSNGEPEFSDKLHLIESGGQISRILMCVGADPNCLGLTIEGRIGKGASEQVI